jgi:nitroreductase/NAD-dependent dihydropyrimidine dehydrogenase PreA subunit
MPELIVDAQSCTRCGLCAAECPWGLIEITEDGVPHLAKAAAKRCIICGHCEAACPSDSLHLDDPRLDQTVYPEQSAGIEAARLGAYLRMRRSIRRYREEPVGRDVIEQVMDIVRYAPTGRNRQDVRWLMIHDTREVRRLTALAIDWMRETGNSGNPLAARYNLSGMVKAWDEGQDYVCLNAPHLAIAHVNEETPAARTNATIALAHLDIIAPSFGIGACWGGIFMQAVKSWEPLQKALDLPHGHTPVHCLMLGYPATSYQRPPKRNPAAIAWR